MGIEDFKRWHWILIGIVVGLALAYVWNGVEPPSVRNVGAAEFERDVTSRDQKLGPLVRRIVIHPPEPNFEALAAQQRIARYESEARAAEEAAKNPPRDVSDRAAFIQQKQNEAAAARAQAEQTRKLESGKRVNLVTYKKWMLDNKTKKNALVDKQFVAEIPFAPPGFRGTVDPNMTVASYLDELRRRYDFIRYSTGWWTTKPATYTLWTIGSVVVIGGLWPIVLAGMIGAGYGRKREPKSKDSLWKYKSAAKAPAPAPPKPAVTAEDHRRLEEMTAKLQSQVGSFGSIPEAAVAGQQSTAPVRKLEGGPLEVAPTAPNPDADDEIEVKGEYYPVLIHHKKQHDEAQPDADEKKN